MNKVLATALLIAAPFVLAASANAAPPFKFEYLPYERCTLSRVDEEDTCLRLKAQADQKCVEMGGVKMIRSGKPVCRLPNQQVGPIKIPTTSTGPTFPDQATVKDPSKGGCVLRPEGCDKPR